MFFEKAIPEKARDAYRRDAWAGMLGGIYTGAIFPFVAFIARDQLHASVTLISLMMAAPFIGSMFALFYAHAMEGRRKLPYVVWSTITARALFFFMLFATTPLRFVLIVAAVQAIATIAGPAYSAVLKEIYPDEHRGRIMAYIRVGLAFATFAATLLVGQILKHHVLNFRFVFPIAALIGIMATLSFSTIKTAPVDPDDPDNSRASIIPFLKNTLAIFKEDRDYTWFALSIFVFGFGNMLASPLYPIFQVDRLHISASQVAMLSNVAAVVWMFSYFYWGKYVDIQSPLKATMINVLLICLVPLIYFLAKNVWMLIPAAVVSGVVTSGLELSYFNGILFFAKDGRESHYQALHSFLLGIRGTIAPFCGAAMITLFRGQGIDVKFVFLISMSIMLLGGVLQTVGVKRRY